MHKTNFKTFFLAISTLFLLAVFGGCADLGNSTYPGNAGSYNDPYYSNDYQNDYYRRREWERARDERRELDRERERLEDERERLEDERKRLDSTPAPAPVPQERCPAGFSPRDRSCSPKERKNGCRDVRLPSGLGCVSR